MFSCPPRFRPAQGSLRAFFAPNNVTTPGPKIMEKGEIGWAGGSAGPDFFIYLGDSPATHWKHDHTVIQGRGSGQEESVI